MARRTETKTASHTPSSSRRRFRRSTRGAGPIVLEDDALIGEVPTAPPSQTASVATTGAGTERGRAAGHPKGSSSGQLLLADAKMASLLANESRYRATERLFGVRREDANLATAIALLTLANAAYERAQRVKPPQPSTAAANWAIGLGVLRESIYGVAGPTSRDTPLAGTLIAIAILGGLAGPPVVRSMRNIRSSSRRLKSTFRGRYGHLVKLGRGN